MKAIGIILLICVLRFPFAFGQTENKEGVFILERKTLEFGKTFKDWNKKDPAGEHSTWYLRNSIGYLAPTGLYLPAAATANVEVGYKWQVLEVGWLHTHAAIPLGSQTSVLFFPFSLPTPTPASTILYNYELPAITNTFSDHLNLSLHLPIAAVPVFVKYGLGFQQQFFSNSFSIKSYFEDGSTKRRYVASGQRVADFRTFSSMFSLGFSNGPFFCSFDFFPNLRSTGSSKAHQVKAGFQLTGGQNKIAPTWKPIDAPVRVPNSRLSIAYYFQTLVDKNTTTANGLELMAGRAITENWEMQLGLQYSHQGQGYQKETPSVQDIKNNPNGLLYLQNPLSQLRRARLSAQYTKLPEKAVHWNVHGGLGWHFSNYSLLEMLRFPEFRPTFQHYPGVHAGAGLQFRYFYSSVQLNKVIGAQIPVHFEWRTGIQLSFGEQ